MEMSHRIITIRILRGFFMGVQTFTKLKGFIMNKKILVAAIALGLGTQAQAGTDEEIALLKKQVEMLSQKISQLEESNKKVVAHQESEDKHEKSKNKSLSMLERVKFSADLRDRFEYIDQRGKETRKRNRVRLRVGATMQVNDDFDIGFRLASGGDDPTSTNQTLDGAFSTKGIQLDLAFFNWKMNDQFTLSGGKMKNPLNGKNPVIWDGDLNPEGFALGFDNGSFEAKLVGFSVDERSSADDALLFGGQLTKSFKTSDNSKLVAGLGYYDYQNLQGATPLYDGKAHGNTLDADGGIANDFNTAELFLEYSTKLGNHPLKVFVNAYQNTQADDLDSAWTTGFKYGKVKAPGSWDFGYSYLDVEADAVYGLFNDSDFGAGNTDSKGHILKAGYGLMKNTALGLTYISSELNQSAASQIDYDRLQLDLKLKF